MDTVTLTIDGRQVTVAKGRSVLQAAIEAGINVPYYCYHPALGVDGSCRVCVVKIEKMPKLQVSCSVTATDGMVVQTATQEVEDARAGVFEFLLLNHPLDCPVCDKGGECPLQDFSYAFGRDDSRMEFPRRTFDGDGVKADVDFGPTLMLNRNRCILCTRCVRFMQDIDGDAQIGIMNRGNGSEIATFEEHGVHSLLSGNLMDVCPVGAITTRDYRFKSRPWDNPGAVDTICTLCEKGCNTTMWLRAKPEWAKGAQLIRVTPRLNEAVNGYWMCDIGRFDYHWIESDARLTQPMVRGAGGLAPTPWDTAIAAAATALKAGRAERRRRRLDHQRQTAAGGHQVRRAHGERAECRRRPSPRPDQRRAGRGRAVARRPARRRRGRQGLRAVRARPRAGRIDRRRRVDRGLARQGHAEDADRAGLCRDADQ
jgi:NADH-quinone oxidoreductase subunit G